MGSPATWLTLFAGQYPVMERFADASPVPLIDSRAAADPLRLAVAAYLARYTLRCTSAGCRKCAGSSRRLCRAGSRSLRGGYRMAVIDGRLDHSPAEYVRRPTVPPESRTLRFTHLQFKAMLTVARESPNRCDFTLTAMLGLLGLRIFEATGADPTPGPDFRRPRFCPHRPDRPARCLLVLSATGPDRASGG